MLHHATRQTKHSWEAEPGGPKTEIQSDKKTLSQINNNGGDDNNKHAILP